MIKIYKKVAKDRNLSYKVVEDLYTLYWSFIREHIIKLPLKENLTEEDFDKLKNNFTLPLLGKLSCTYKQWLSSRKRLMIHKQKYNEYKKNKAIKLPSDNNCSSI